MSRSAACNLQPLSCSKKDDPSPLGRAEATLHCATALMHSVRRGARGAAVDMIGNFFGAQVLARETGFVTLRPGRSRSRTVALLFLGSRLDYRHFLDVKSVKDRSAVAAGPILCSMGPGS